MAQVSFTNKTISREYAFKFIYKLFLEGFAVEKAQIIEHAPKLDEAILEFEESYIKEDEEHINNELNPSIQDYGKALITGFLAHENEIIESVMSFLKNKNFEAVGNIEKAVLCLGAYELTFTNTPKKVVINEYINLVKKFGSKESSSFINGILDKISNN